MGPLRRRKAILLWHTLQCQTLGWPCFRLEVLGYRSEVGLFLQSPVGSLLKVAGALYACSVLGASNAHGLPRPRTWGVWGHRGVPCWLGRELILGSGIIYRAYHNQRRKHALLTWALRRDGVEQCGHGLRCVGEKVQREASGNTVPEMVILALSKCCSCVARLSSLMLALDVLGRITS